MVNASRPIWCCNDVITVNKRRNKKVYIKKEQIKEGLVRHVPQACSQTFLGQGSLELGHFNKHSPTIQERGSREILHEKFYPWMTTIGTSFSCHKSMMKLFTETYKS